MPLSEPRPSRGPAVRMRPFPAPLSLSPTSARQLRGRQSSHQNLQTNRGDPSRETRLGLQNGYRPPGVAVSWRFHGEAQVRAVITHHRRASRLYRVDADLPGPELDCGVSSPNSDGSQSGMAPGREAMSDASLVPRSRTRSVVQPTAMPNARPAANASPAPTVSITSTGTAAASR